MLVAIVGVGPGAHDSIVPIDGRGRREGEPVLTEPDYSGSVVSELAIHMAVRLEPGEGESPWPN